MNLCPAGFTARRTFFHIFLHAADYISTHGKRLVGGERRTGGGGEGAEGRQPGMHRCSQSSSEIIRDRPSRLQVIINRPVWTGKWAVDEFTGAALTGDVRRCDLAIFEVSA
jgi:hypothetical protein